MLIVELQLFKICERNTVYNYVLKLRIILTYSIILRVTDANFSRKDYLTLNN